MKRRSLFRLLPWISLLLCLSLGLGACGGCRKKKKAPAKRPPVTEVSASPEIVAASPAPATSPAPRATPGPGEKPPATPLPGATPVPGLAATPAPGAGLGEQVPSAESLPTESQAMIQLSVGEPIKTAEGSTLVLDKVQANYGGKTPLKFLWTILSGPPDSIKIHKPGDLQPRVILGDLDAPTEWVLRLQASDGKTETSADLKISAFPARLQAVGRIGGAWVGVKRMGDKWVAARGNDVEIFGPDLSPLAKIGLQRSVAQFFAMVDAAGKGTIYVQVPEGTWSVLQSDPVNGFKKIDFPPLGKNIRRRIIPFDYEGVPYFFALLERSIDLWNLSDPLHPKLKTSLGGFLKNPLFLAFSQRNIYVAEEDSIHLIDFSTGNLVASIPSGGSITSLATYSVDGKNYLMAAIGADRTAQGRKDYGLRIFEIDTGGRLGGDRRVTVGESLPIDHATLIPGANLALLSVPGAQGLSLRMIDLKQGKEVPLSGDAAQGFLAISEVTTGRVADNSVALIADGNQLKVLAFRPQGEGYSVTQLKSLPGILSAAWVKASPDATRVWVGDEGTQAGGALGVLNGQDFTVSEAANAPDGTYPAHADFRSGGDLSPLLYLAEDPTALKRGAAEGLLGLASSNPKDPAGVELSTHLIGAVSPQGQLRGSGIAGRSLETGLRIAVAIARVSGNIGGAGVAILDKPAAQPAKAFLTGDLVKALGLIPLQDARDVALTADGKGAFAAAGATGLIAIDLEKKSPVARMSLGTEEWIADRVLLGSRGDLAVVSFVNRATRKVLIKTFGIGANFQMQEYGSLAGLPAAATVEGVRAPRPALTEDDLYLFVPIQPRVLGVFNLSNPADPAKIAELEVDGEIRGVALANRFKDIFLALGPAGVAKLNFGF
ncbi:MAG: hypothetical protein IT572_01585 [Deltaproteobacteria bacterium]|nr:hypothetical protein [Deltaproteobacteria bacterium]